MPSSFAWIIWFIYLCQQSVCQTNPPSIHPTPSPTFPVLPTTVMHFCCASIRHLKMSVNGQNTVLVPGDTAVFNAPAIGSLVTISVEFEWDSTDSSIYCPTCLRQILFGVSHVQHDCLSTYDVYYPSVTLSVQYTSDGTPKTIHWMEALYFSCSDALSSGILEIEIGYIRGVPTTHPTRHPTLAPTFGPTLHSSEPTSHPTFTSSIPTSYPTVDPTTHPTFDPTLDPTEHLREREVKKTNETDTTVTNDSNQDEKVDQENIIQHLELIIPAAAVCVVACLIGLICILYRGKQSESATQSAELTKHVEVSECAKTELDKKAQHNVMLEMKDILNKRKSTPQSALQLQNVRSVSHNEDDANVFGYGQTNVNGLHQNNHGGEDPENEDMLHDIGINTLGECDVRPTPRHVPNHNNVMYIVNAASDDEIIVGDDEPDAGTTIGGTIQ
eukprot:241290_1